MVDRIKVLIVEDSPTVAQILAKLLENDPQLQVVGVATDGTQAIRYVARFLPHVITMDVNMPHMGGLEATEYVMAHYPTPILVLTASLAKQDIDLSFKMLAAGALEIIEKPHADGWGRESQRLVERIKLLSRIKVITHIRGKSRSLADFALNPTKARLSADEVLRFEPRRPNPSDVVTAPLDPGKIYKPPTAPAFTHSEVVALRTRNLQLVGIAASTGGPPALSKVLKPLSAKFPIPILLVQHIPVGFSKGLADWLNGETKLTVKLATEGELALPGYAYLPPDDSHMVIGPDMRLRRDKSGPRYGLRPSADVTFESMAAAMPGKMLSVILTGMGRDGAQGMKALHEAGNYNIAQDEATSVIFGMPKSAIELGVVDKILPINEIPNLLRQIFGPLA